MGPYRYARSDQVGFWDKAAKDIAKLNRLVAKAQKKPAEVATIRADIKKMKGLVQWAVRCFDQSEVDPWMDAADALSAEFTVEKLLAFRDAVGVLVRRAAPEQFTYSGFSVSNPERVSDRLCRKTLSGVDYLLALFKKRDVSKLLREGVSEIRILPADILGATSGGSYQPSSQRITLDAARPGDPPGVFIERMAHAFLHEFGHHVHINFLPPDAVAAWDGAWDAPEDGKTTPDSVSQYGRKDKFEDFAETFVAFMAAPERLTPNAKFRMQRALSLSGLYGKPVMRLASDLTHRVVTRFSAKP